MIIHMNRPVVLSKYVHLDKITMIILLDLCITLFNIGLIMCGSVSSKDSTLVCNDEELKEWQMNAEVATTIHYNSCTLSGIVTSPNYPDPYPEGVDSFLSIKSDDPQITSIRIQFLDLDIELSNACEQDGLDLEQIIDLPKDDNEPNQDSNGNRENRVKVSSERYTSDNFHLLHLVDSTNKKITIDDARQSMLTSFNSLRGLDQDDNREEKNLAFAKFYGLCGSTIPQPILTRISSLRLHFYSDDLSLGQRGFKLKFEFLRVNSSSINGCASNEYRCRNRRCIDKRLVCNHIDDCEDGSDEDKSAECQSLPSIPYRIDYKCGLSYFQPKKRDGLSSRIVGGESAIKWSWPSQVDIQHLHIEPLSHICGGILIHPLYVLSAAHCFSSPWTLNFFKFKFGAHDLLNPSKDKLLDGSSSTQTRYASSINIFPGDMDVQNTRMFGHRGYEITNDIALIRLNAPVKLTKNVWPACLPNIDEPLKAGRLCYASGWGITRGSGSSFLLKQVEQPITHEGDCKSEFSDLSINDHSQICVKSRNLEGVCHGDSGGPLYCEDIVSEEDDEATTGNLIPSESTLQLSQISHNKNESSIYTKTNEKNLINRAELVIKVGIPVPENRSISSSDHNFELFIKNSNRTISIHQIDNGDDTQVSNVNYDTDDYEYEYIAPIDKTALMISEDEKSLRTGNSTELNVPYGKQISDKHDTRWTVHGLTSSGSDTNFAGGYCGVRYTATLYSRVSTKIDWILSHMAIKPGELSAEDKKNSPQFNYLFRNKNKRSKGKEKLYMTVH